MTSFKEKEFQMFYSICITKQSVGFNVKMKQWFQTAFDQFHNRLSDIFLFPAFYNMFISINRCLYKQISIYLWGGGKESFPPTIGEQQDIVPALCVSLFLPNL